MLVLAGVSINAIIGDNGVITNAQYASFLQEMTQVNEAYRMWKIGNEGDVLPTKGLCKSNLINKGRLKGEIGYFREWEITDSKPSIDLLSESFSSEFEGNVLVNPMGVEDLYLLDTKQIDVNTNNQFVIDASTEMIYSLNGFSISGVEVYSLQMLKAVKTGTMENIIFASYDIGSGDEKKHVGNVTTEYLYDDDGEIILDSDNNPVKNPNYDPVGFRLLTDQRTNNIFKLYNNGDLYGKGVKGSQLNTSASEMEKINQYNWKKWSIPADIKNCKQVCVGNYNMWFVDENDDLWAIGENTDNMFGLDKEQNKSYTGRAPIKLNLNGKKVDKVFVGSKSVFVITQDKYLLACGYNVNYNLGLGHKNEVTSFTIVENISDVDKIQNIDANEGYGAVMTYNDGRFYYSGKNLYNFFGVSSETRANFTTFTRILDGTIGDDIDQDVVDISIGRQILILCKNGEVWMTGYDGYVASGSVSGKTLRKVTGLSDIKKMFKCRYNAYCFFKDDGNAQELWGVSESTDLGSDYGLTTTKTIVPVKIELPDELDNSKEGGGIKEIRAGSGFIYCLSKNGKLFGSGAKSRFGNGISSGVSSGIEYLGIDGMTNILSETIQICEGGLSFGIIQKDGDFYITGNSDIMFGNNMLQGGWTLVAQNVKFFDAGSNVYVDKDNNLWVAGDSRDLGLGDASKTYKNIPEYIIHPDLNLRGKVKEAYSAWGVTYIITMPEEDSNGVKVSNLMATGRYIIDGTKTNGGWSDGNDKYSFETIVTNVKFFSRAETFRQKIAIDGDGRAWGWGKSYGGANGRSGNTFNDAPVSYSLPSEIGGVSNIKKLYCTGWQRSFILTKDGKLFKTGSWSNGSFDGGLSKSASFADYTSNFGLQADDQIVDFCAAWDSLLFVVTKKGRVFGYCVDSRHLGVGALSGYAVNLRDFDDYGLTNIEQIVTSGSFSVAVTKDGHVLGTGSNTYGVLGRWKGIIRGEADSRYKNAIDWVVCPELEY